MKKLLSKSKGQFIALLALLAVTAVMFSTGVALAGEEAGAGIAGTYRVESSESTGLPDITQLGAFIGDASSLAVEMFKGEEVGAGHAGRYEVDSSESTGSPDAAMPIFGAFMSSISGLAEEMFTVEEGAGRAGHYEVESSESTGLPDLIIWK